MRRPARRARRARAVALWNFDVSQSSFSAEISEGEDGRERVGEGGRRRRTDDDAVYQRRIYYMIVLQDSGLQHHSTPSLSIHIRWMEGGEGGRTIAEAVAYPINAIYDVKINYTIESIRQ